MEIKKEKNPPSRDSLFIYIYIFFLFFNQATITILENINILKQKTGERHIKSEILPMLISGIQSPVHQINVSHKINQKNYRLFLIKLNFHIISYLM